jgi:hypothetical protein
MWVRFETYHAVTFFTAEARAATDALGCKGGWMGYFGTRAAPLGAAPAVLVASAFYNFRPQMVARAVPDCWAIAPPDAYLEARLKGVDAALRRLLGEQPLAGPEMAQAAQLAVAAAELAPIAGRPLAAANAALPSPAPAHLALWQATAVLRESRGDGHVAALVSGGLDPCEALVLFAADKSLETASMRQARGWTAEEWQAAGERLAHRGLLTADGTVSPRGRELRDWIEECTDDGGSLPWVALGPERTRELERLLTPIAQRLAADNNAIGFNPMALDAAAELAAG